MWSEKPKVIMTCFAGRKRNMDILLKYIDVLHKQGDVSEFHIWNFTRDPKDEKWLTETFSPVFYDFVSEPNEVIPDDVEYVIASSYDYMKTPLVLKKGCETKIEFKAYSDAHILLTNKTTCEDVAEICIGGWNNSVSVIRRSKQGKSVSSYACNYMCWLEKWTELNIIYSNDKTITVQHKGRDALSMKVDTDDVDELCINVASWGDRKTIWKYKKPEPERVEDGEINKANTQTLKNTYSKVFTVHDKSKWLEYYHHYTQRRYPNHVIIKCDDDIVFMDTQEFSGFIKRRIENSTSILAFPSIVNNGVCAYHQQQLGLIPRTLSTFPYDTLCGKLWENGQLCQNLHEFFIDTCESWLTKARAVNVKTISQPIGDRISINCFAIKSEFLYIYQEIGNDDEKELTVTMTQKHSKEHYIDPHFTVAHLGFYKQRETGLDEDLILTKYSKLADTFLCAS